MRIISFPGGEESSPSEETWLAELDAALCDQAEGPAQIEQWMSKLADWQRREGVDSSALVKRYVIETGTAWVRGITRHNPSTVIYIARITADHAVEDIRVDEPAIEEVITRFYQLHGADEV